MAKNARTHDISMIDYHVTDVETLAKVLNDAVTAACPKASTTRYRGVYVLLLCWAYDDLGVETELDGLEAVFQTVYHYRTDRWKIPSSSSHNALVFRIMQVLQEIESKDELFITYYGGHGYMNDDRQCVWLWYVTISNMSIDPCSDHLCSWNQLTFDQAISNQELPRYSGRAYRRCSRKPNPTYLFC